MTTLICHTASSREAQAAGYALAQVLVGGDLVSLQGDLGAGKTTTTVGIAKGLGATSTVRSPTFTFLHHHRLSGVAEELLHVDLYRLEDESELEGLGLFDLMDDETVVVVEWMERAGEQLPPASVTVEIVHLGEERREVAITLDVARSHATSKALEGQGFTVTLRGDQ